MLGRWSRKDAPPGEHAAGAAAARLALAFVVSLIFAVA